LNSKTKIRETVFSEKDGSFEFNELDAGTYLLTAKKRGYSKYSKIVKLGEGEEEEKEIVMRKASK